MESHTQVGALLEENDTWEKKLQDPSATPMFLPFEFLTEITCNFSSERELGRGGYGVVYKGVLPSGKTIAVKKLFDLHRLEDEKFQKEVSYLMGIKHTNVVLFVGYCAKSSWEAIDLQGGGSYIFAETRERLLCFEHVCNKSLDKYISDESSGLEWEMRYEIVRGICAGLHYLHEECHIVHLDLKPENILMDATMVPKIADFGLSKIFGDKQTRIITVNRPGTHGYMAPEYLIQGVVSIKADIYSLGVIIIEILTGYRNYPLSSLPHFQQLSEDNSRQITASFQYFKENILETWRKRLQKSQGDTILEQIRVCAELGIQCVEFNPENRPVTRHMIDRLDEVNIMDISIKSSESSTPPVLQVGEASDTVQQGDTRSKISREQEEGCEVHNAELADVYENIRAADIKSEIEVPFHRVTCEVNKHHVLESMLRDESVEPTCLELSLLEDITNNFSKDHEIARSRLGVVYKGKLSSGSTVVVKRLAIASAVEDSLFLHAVNSLMSIKHRNIVRFLGYCSNVQEKVTREGDTSIIFMVRKRLLCFEYLRKGNLQKHLTDESRGFHWHARYQTIKGICQGLQYLHDDYIPHLDLKPDNILFSETMVPKILDYGFSRVFTNEIRQTIFKNIDGSLACMATPEYVTGAEITLKSDIYSLGLIIMQIVTGPNNMDYSNIASIVESWRSRLELEASKEHTFETCYQQVKVCVDIGMRCMDHDPRNRPVTQYIINCLDRMERERSVGSYMIFPSESTSQPSDAEFKESPVPHAPPAVQPVGRKISREQEEGCEVHNAELADVYENIRAADIKSEIEVPFHRVTCEVNKHHVLESMLRDESVEPTCLELSLLEDITNNFSKDHEIARSRLGVVYKGKLSSGSTVVVKRLAIASAVEDSLFLHAVNSLMSIKHRNIVRFLGYCSNVQEKVTREGDTSIIFMVRKRLLCFEYLRKGNLQKHLTDESRGFHWHARYQTIKGICQGLQYLHDDYIPHLDLKPDNILFSETMVPKILDYGFSRVFTNEIRQTIFKNIDGSLACMATPEYVTGAEITLKSDIYSLGLIIMQIVTGPNNMDYSNIASIVESWRSRLELEASKEHTFETCYQQVKVCVDIGMRCMDHDPRNRPVTQYIINCLDRMERERSVGSYMIFPSESTSQPSDAELKESPVPHAPPAVQPVGRKIVLNVPMNYNKSRSVIMEVASKITGIMSLAYDSDKSTLTVVGDVDPVAIVTRLRKMKYPVEVVAVEVIRTK